MRQIAGDYGLECPRCGSDDCWDRLFGDCYVCGLRGPRRSFVAGLIHGLMLAIGKVDRISELPHNTVYGSSHLRAGER